LNGFFGGQVGDEWALGRDAFSGEEQKKIDMRRTHCMRDSTMSVEDILRRHLSKVHYGSLSRYTRRRWQALSISLWFRIRLENILNISRTGRK
jgi:hypothetical protein